MQFKFENGLKFYLLNIIARHYITA